MFTSATSAGPRKTPAEGFESVTVNVSTGASSKASLRMGMAIVVVGCPPGSVRRADFPV
jgi:hypothetical protein